MRGAPRAVLPGVAALAAVVLAFVLPDTGVREPRRARVDVARDARAAPGDPLRAPAAPARADAWSEPRRPSATEQPRAADRAAEELAALLLGVGFDPNAFERGVGALAAQLGPGAAEVLAARLAEPSGADVQLVSSAVLLRALARRGLEVPGLHRAALERLGALAWAPGNGALGEAAATALARLGTTGQRRALLQRVLVTEGEARERAARALRHAPARELAHELARTPLPTGSPRTDELLVLAARGLLADADAELGGREREALRALLAANGLEGRARERARAALDEGAGEDVVLAALLDGGVDRGLRGAAARAVAAEPARAPAAARIEAASVLSAEARASDPATRRSALYALASLGEPRGLDDVLSAAREDPDPAVRAAGLRALRALPPEERRTALEESARTDGSAAVRALARSELARAAADDL